MCGIAAIAARQPVNPAALRRMTALMAHRGPDGVGFWQNETSTVQLGHRRLAILDGSSAGAQPMTWPPNVVEGALTDIGNVVDAPPLRSDYVLTFNGEIYNYLELRRELRALGHSFRGQSDTEVLLASYAEWGTDCLTRLNGMFAFVLYDARRHQLFGARDRYGEKPFLFCRTPDFVAVASEYKALLALAECRATLDEERLMLGAFVAGKGLDADRQTVFGGIEQLRPAEALTVDLTRFTATIWTYWSPERHAHYARLSEADATHLFRELLTDAIRLRLRSDVPVGSCLSGGLDSGAIVSIVTKKLWPAGAPYHTFTGVFPGSSADEWALAERVVADTGAVAHRVAPTPDGLAAELAEFVWLNELPVSSASQYAQWCVFRLANEQGVTVLLDGQGADELLGGYEQYFRFYLQTIRPAHHGRPAGPDYVAEEAAIRRRYARALPTRRSAWAEAVPFGLRHFWANQMGQGQSVLYGMRGPISRKLNQAAGYETLPGWPPLAGALRQDSFGRFLTTLLRYGDRNSMAHSREVRLPFCDYRLAELVLSLPAPYLMGEAQTKRLLREATRGLLTEPVRTRWNKQGFRPPQEEWFRGELLQLTRALFARPSFQESPYWDARWWQSALRRLNAGDGALGWSVWQPFSLEAWRQHFVENEQFRSRISVFA